MAQASRAYTSEYSTLGRVYVPGQWASSAALQERPAKIQAGSAKIQAGAVRMQARPAKVQAGPAEIPQPKRVKRTRQRPQPENTIIREAEEAIITHKMLAKAIIFMAFVGAILITTIWMSAKATEIKYSINKMQSDNVLLQNEISMLDIKVESANSIESIEEYATDELGMQYPKSQQCIYVESDAKPSDSLVDMIREKAYK